MKKFFLIPYVIIGLILFGCSEDDAKTPEPEPIDNTPVAVLKTNPMKVYVHYMPWFESPETSYDGNWGIHWTMATKDPNKVDELGKREIAAYFYPSIGPYASGDKNVIEYHLLLMKYAGIDGVIIDWYGSYNINDFGGNKTNSEALIDRIDDVGLTFALTYEDWTVNTVVEKGEAATLVDAAIEDFTYMERNYFNLDTYIKINNKPLLTVFGPQAIQTASDWTAVLSSVAATPTFLSLWYESADLGANASGEFSWVYQNNSHIDNFYKNQINKFDFSMGSAYPGFKDFYADGGWGAGQGWTIEHNNSATFEQTLSLAENAKVDYLQLVTWNDFGEGTMIEPTQEFGYLFLEKLQVFTGVTYSTDAFEYITKLYNLRISMATDSEAQKQLDEAFIHFVKLELDEAKAIIDAIK